MNKKILPRQWRKVWKFAWDNGEYSIRVLRLVEKDFTGYKIVYFQESSLRDYKILKKFETKEIAEVTGLDGKIEDYVTDWIKKN